MENKGKDNELIAVPDCDPRYEEMDAFDRGHPRLQTRSDSEFLPMLQATAKGQASLLVTYHDKEEAIRMIECCKEAFLTKNHT